MVHLSMYPPDVPVVKSVDIEIEIAWERGYC